MWFGTSVGARKHLEIGGVANRAEDTVSHVDLLALRRVPAPVFGTFTSINPVWAALSGWVLLGQALHANEWFGIGLIVISNFVVSTRGLTSSEESRRAAAKPALRAQ